MEQPARDIIEHPERKLHYEGFGTEKADYCIATEVDGYGVFLYFTSQCPINAKYVPVLEQTAKENNILFHAIHIESREEAHNTPKIKIRTFRFFYACI